MRPDRRAPARAVAARETIPAARVTFRVATRVALLLAALAAAPAPGHAASPEAQEKVESGLMCHCGCTDLTVHVCNCGTAAAIKADIAARLDAGASADQVIDAYVAQYGEKIRSAPTRTGFNLLAWIMPFAVLLAAGFVVIRLIRKWQGGLPAPAPAGAGPATPVRTAAEGRALEERIEREMRETL